MGSTTPHLEIEFVTHACILLKAGEIRVLCDPWLSGSAFHDGWDLLVEPKRDIQELAPTHIWVSHEHPDHFSPRDLLAIPADLRSDITVLYQTTADGKVEGFLRAKGFQVHVLPLGERVELAEGVSVVCDTMGADSWLLFAAGGQTVMNLNDCITGQDILIDDPDRLPTEWAEKIKAHTDTIDVLLTQFSYSNWVGNPRDTHLHRLQARTKLNQVRQQIRSLTPRFVIPFASFVWFSHEDNGHHNQCLNRVSDVVPVIEEEGAEPIVLYPGDVWTVGTNADTQPAQARWDEVYETLGERTPRRSPSVSLEALVEAFTEYQSRVKDRNDWSAILDFKSRDGLPATSLYLTDLGQAVSLDLTDGLNPITDEAAVTDVQLASSSLHYLLTHDWGRGTLMVNARFSADYEGIHRFLAQTQIAYGNNVGLRFPETLPESILRESPSYVAFFARQAIKLKSGSS